MRSFRYRRLKGRSPFSLSAPRFLIHWGGEGRGEVGDSRSVRARPPQPPIAAQWTPPSPPKGRRGNTKWALAGAIALAVFASGLALAASNPQDFSQVERGRYLAVVGDCAGCHTKPGGQDFAGGLPIPTPFGNVVAPNITPDQETGIGNWSDDDFVRAVTQGVRNDGAYLYPAMPYPHYTKVNRDDVLAIRAYLATVPAVSNNVVADQLPFPLSVRGDMLGWNKLYFKPGEFQRDPNKSDEWNRGAYFVEGLMHCGACHTAKNLAGGEKSDEKLRGSPLQGRFAPDITNDSRRGLGGWSIDDIVAYLKTGHNRIAAASGPMADEVSHAGSRMTEADLRAGATY